MEATCSIHFFTPNVDIMNTWIKRRDIVMNRPYFSIGQCFNNPWSRSSLHLVFSLHDKQRGRFSCRSGPHEDPSSACVMAEGVFASIARAREPGVSLHGVNGSVFVCSTLTEFSNALILLRIAVSISLFESALRLHNLFLPNLKTNYKITNIGQDSQKRGRLMEAIPLLILWTDKDLLKKYNVVQFITFTKIIK